MANRYDHHNAWNDRSWSERSSFGEPQGEGLWDRLREGVKDVFRGNPGPKNYTRPDARILEDVCDRLGLHPDLDASDIEVTVKEGEVMLMGTVEDRASKRIAEDLAENVRGVKDVHNHLKIDRNRMIAGGTSASSVTGSTSRVTMPNSNH